MFHNLENENHNARLRIIWCKPELSDEELQRRIDLRMASGYTGGTRTAARIRELERRYEPIILPHLVLDTASPHDPISPVETAIDYITNVQSHDRSRF